MTTSNDTARNELIGWLVSSLKADHPDWLANEHSRLLRAAERNPDDGEVYARMADVLANMIERLPSPAVTLCLSMDALEALWDYDAGARSQERS
jgi:hypothetical protein